MKLHANIDVMEKVEKRAELERRKEAYERLEQQREKTRTIAQEIGVQPSCYENSIRNTFVKHVDDLRMRL